MIRGIERRGGGRKEGGNSGALAFTLLPPRAAHLDPKLDFQSRVYTRPKTPKAVILCRKELLAVRKGEAWPSFSAAAAVAYRVLVASGFK